MNGDPCTEYEERAAILEFCAGYSRPDAERIAREQIERKETEETYGQ